MTESPDGLVQVTVTDAGVADKVRRSVDQSIEVLRRRVDALGTTEPTDLATTWTAVSASWVALGYTNAGSEFHYQLNADPVDVAEELDPVSYSTTGRGCSRSTCTFRPSRSRRGSGSRAGRFSG